MKKFYLGALGCLLAMGANAQKVEQVGTMQGEVWSLLSIPTEYAYEGKSSVYTVNETETDVEFTVYNKSFAVDRTFKVANPMSYDRTVVESRELVVKPIGVEDVECGAKCFSNNSSSVSFPAWWAYNKCSNTTCTDQYVEEWFEYLKTMYEAYNGTLIVEKKEFEGGTLFITNRTFESGTHVYYFKDNMLYEAYYAEGKLSDSTSAWAEMYLNFYNMQMAEFTQENIVEYINSGYRIYFEDLLVSFNSYIVDSIATESDGSMVFYTNAYAYRYEYNFGKQYPMLKFVWNKSENTLTAVGTKYDVSLTGEWKKSEEAYSLDEWLWDAAMTPFHVGQSEGLSGCATQTFFNNDEKWEFLRPVFEEVVNTDKYYTYEKDNDNDGEIDYKQTRYVNKPKALEVVSESGNVLTTIALPEADYYYPLAIQWDGDTYFGLSISRRVETDEINPDTESYYYYEEYTVIYSIDKNASSVKKIASTPAMRVSPAVANRNSTINVTLDAETAKNGGELVITDSNGRTISRSRVEAGQTSVPVTTDRMGSGVYNITLTEKGQKVENARIIVK